MAGAKDINDGLDFGLGDVRAGKGDMDFVHEGSGGLRIVRLVLSAHGVEKEHAKARTPCANAQAWTPWV
jgi:hypothetical protein